VFGGSHSVDKIWGWVLAKEALLPDTGIRVSVIALYDPEDPPPGVPVTTNVNIGEGGTTTTTDPLVKSVSPYTLPLSVVTSVELFGENFVVGPPSTTFNGQGPGTITITNIVVDSTTHATADIIVSDGVPYSIVSVNPDGKSGVGSGVLTGEPVGAEVLPIITAVNPYLIPTLPFPATSVEIFGDNFVVGIYPGPGTQFIGQGDGIVAITNINVDTTKHATAKISVSAAVTYDIVAVNADGASGIGIDVITGT
jgi:hypothetical protein